MVCGSPSRANKFPVLVVLVVVVTVIAFQSQPVVSYHVDDGSAVYYERYPLHGPNKPDNEQIESSNTPIRNESIGNTKEMDDERFSVNCTEPTIQDFPPDMFTQEQRQKGGVVIHFMLCIYTMLMIGVVIDEYFVPSLEIIAEVLHMSPDVAGATIMAIGTSSPELFINIVGTFITQGDIGVGTIVGSAAFNILAAPACCGLFTGFVRRTKRTIVSISFLKKDKYLALFSMQSNRPFRWNGGRSHATAQSTVPSLLDWLSSCRTIGFSGGKL